MDKSRNEQIILGKLLKAMFLDLESDPKSIEEWVSKTIKEIEERRVSKTIKEILEL